MLERPWLLCIVPVALLVVMAWQHRWVGDDAFVYFRVVKQLEAGHGPVFNVGQRVEATTSPLWLMMLFVADVIAPLRLEWISVLLGMSLAASGLVFAQRGAWLALGHTDRRRLIVPFGALIVAALPPMWDFSTSGLETGLCFAWLGACFWALAVRYDRHRSDPTAARTRPPAWLCILIGLGPLVRPDFAIYSATFIVAMLVIDPGENWADRARALIAVFVVPVASELFRMGYYATLVPNTALAKESGRAYWHQGWEYLRNYDHPYRLWFPLLVVATVVGVETRLALRAKDRCWVALAGAPVIGGLAHALWVVRVGGDFMHARFLLPATFAVLLPVSVLPMRGWHWIPTVPIVAWAIICALSFRVALGGQNTIDDERRYWQTQTGHSYPVVMNDFRATAGFKNGTRSRTLLASGAHVALAPVVYPPPELAPLAPRVHAPVVIQVGTVGVSGYRAPLDVEVLDALGLADPLASRLRILKRGRPGHEKALLGLWVLARVTNSNDTSVAAARRALGCGGLHELLVATTGPLSFTDVFRNMFEAPHLTSLRFSGEATIDEAAFCK
ncbi:MAG TPA: hypothetical protein VIK54_07445 [Acidimicrobiia bacterium]